MRVIKANASEQNTQAPSIDRTVGRKMYFKGNKQRISIIISPAASIDQPSKHLVRQGHTFLLCFFPASNLNINCDSDEELYSLRTTRVNSCAHFVPWKNANRVNRCALKSLWIWDMLLLLENNLPLPKQFHMNSCCKYTRLGWIIGPNTCNTIWEYSVRLIQCNGKKKKEKNGKLNCVPLARTFCHATNILSSRLSCRFIISYFAARGPWNEWTASSHRSRLNSETCSTNFVKSAQVHLKFLIFLRSHIYVYHFHTFICSSLCAFSSSSSSFSLAA